MNVIVTHLKDYLHKHDVTHLFLYTKPTTAPAFSSLGFHEIAQVEGKVSFMENIPNGFSSYLNQLRTETKTYQNKHGITATAAGDGKIIAAIVMNANPFTLGHRYLIETAAKDCDLLHFFLLSEDSSLVPYAVRKKLVLAGTQHIPNIVYHDTDQYLVSSATFPSYFQKEPSQIAAEQAYLDVAVFIRIAQELGITRRYVGDEPFSPTTNLYNTAMKDSLPKHGISCYVIERTGAGGVTISASEVRARIGRGELDSIKDLVPPTTYEYFTSPAALPVIEKIKANRHIEKP